MQDNGEGAQNVIEGVQDLRLVHGAGGKKRRGKMKRRREMRDEQRCGWVMATATLVSPTLLMYCNPQHHTGHRRRAPCRQ